MDWRKTNLKKGDLVIIETSTKKNLGTVKRFTNTQIILFGDKPEEEIKYWKINGKEVGSSSPYDCIEEATPELVAQIKEVKYRKALKQSVKSQIEAKINKLNSEQLLFLVNWLEKQ